jgi:glutaredoxin 3
MQFLIFLVSFLQLATAFLQRKVTTGPTRLFHTYSPRETAQAHIKSSKIMVFSKTYCPYCKKAKEAISKITSLYSVCELDVVSDGAEMQAALLDMTGQKTVPNIFVNGKHIGGCDSTVAAIASGEFQKLIG